MKKPGLVDGVTVAMIISLGAAVASLLLGGFIVYALLFELLLTNVLIITIFSFIVRFLKFQHFMIASHFAIAFVKFSSTI
jgi:hypothetical protein